MYNLSHTFEYVKKVWKNLREMKVKILTLVMYGFSGGLAGTE